jgi:hypothetical protein
MTIQPIKLARQIIDITTKNNTLVAVAANITLQNMGLKYIRKRKKKTLVLLLAQVVQLVFIQIHQS